MIDIEQLETVLKQGRVLDVWFDSKGFRASVVMRNGPIHEDHIFSAPTVAEAIRQAVEFPGD